MFDQKKIRVLSGNSLPNQERNLNYKLIQYYRRNQMVDAPLLMRKLELILPQYQLLHGNCRIEKEVYRILFLCLKEETASLSLLKTKTDWYHFYINFCKEQQKEVLAFHDCRTPDNPLNCSTLSWYQFSTQTGILGYCYQKESPLSRELEKRIVQNKIKVLS